MGFWHKLREVVRNGRSHYSEGGFWKVASELPSLASDMKSAFRPLIRSDMKVFGVNSVEDSYLELSVEKLRSAEYHVQNDNSILIGELIKKYNSVDDPKILEIGGNAGRHLSYLHDIGYTNLHMIEINQSGIDLYRSEHPEAALDTSIHHGRAQFEVEELLSDEFDIVYTNAVLQHIPDIDNLLSEVARVSRGNIILMKIETVEDDLEHIPGLIFRNFHTLFEHPYYDVLTGNDFKEELYVPGRAPDTDEEMRKFEGQRPDERYSIRVFTPNE